MIHKVVKLLTTSYPIAECSLSYSSPLELLISIRLSAQCTDAQVNRVTPELFVSFKTVQDFASANYQDIEKYIYSCGFYKIKSRDIVDMCKIIMRDFNGKIPQNLDDLVSLPGIGRKTANLFLGQMYKIPALVVDTHFIRITKRLGFHDTSDARKIEKIMTPIVPPNEMLSFSHRLIMHGRAVCKARKPLCDICCLQRICKTALINNSI